jgi:hypothetical protein
LSVFLINTLIKHADQIRESRWPKSQPTLPKAREAPHFSFVIGVGSGPELDAQALFQARFFRVMLGVPPFTVKKSGCNLLRYCWQDAVWLGIRVSAFGGHSSLIDWGQASRQP